MKLTGINKKFDFSVFKGKKVGIPEFQFSSLLENGLTNKYNKFVESFSADMAYKRNVITDRGAIEDVIYNKVPLRDKYTFIGGEPFFQGFSEKWETAEVRVLLYLAGPYREFDFSVTHYSLINAIHKEFKGKKVLVDVAFISPYADLFIKKGIAPVFGVNTKRAPQDFDVVFLSLSVQTQYLRAMSFLYFSGYPLLAEKRDTLLFIGGDKGWHIAPQVFGYFLGDDTKYHTADCILFGYGEQFTVDFLHWYITKRDVKDIRTHFQKDFEGAQGVFIPQFYTPLYTYSDYFKCMVFSEYSHEKGPDIIDIKYNVVDEEKAGFLPFTEECALYVEEGASTAYPIASSCASLCFFCSEPFTSGKYREVPYSTLKDSLEEWTLKTGEDFIAPFSLNWNHFSKLTSLIRDFPHLRHTVSSFRVDQIYHTPELSRVSRKFSRKITVAVEGISQRIRDFLHKSLKQEHLDLFMQKMCQGRESLEIKLYYIFTGHENLQDVEEFQMWLEDLQKKFSSWGVTRARVDISMTPLQNEVKTPVRYFAPNQSGTGQVYREIMKAIRKVGFKFSTKGNPALFLCQHLLYFMDSRIFPLHFPLITDPESISTSVPMVYSLEEEGAWVSKLRALGYFSYLLQFENFTDDYKYSPDIYEREVAKLIKTMRPESKPPKNVCYSRGTYYRTTKATNTFFKKRTLYFDRDVSYPEGTLIRVVDKEYSGVFGSVYGIKYNIFLYFMGYIKFLGLNHTFFTKDKPYDFNFAVDIFNGGISTKKLIQWNALMKDALVNPDNKIKDLTYCLRLSNNQKPMCIDCGRCSTAKEKSVFLNRGIEDLSNLYDMLARKSKPKEVVYRHVFFVEFDFPYNYIPYKAKVRLLQKALLKGHKELFRFYVGKNYNPYFKGQDVVYQGVTPVTLSFNSDVMNVTKYIGDMNKTLPPFIRVVGSMPETSISYFFGYLPIRMSKNDKKIKNLYHLPYVKNLKIIPINKDESRLYFLISKSPAILFKALRTRKTSIGEVFILDLFQQEKPLFLFSSEDFVYRSFLNGKVCSIGEIFEL